MSLQAVRPAQAKMDTIQPVEAVIEAYFERGMRDAQTVSAAYAALWTEMDRLIKAGGKRLRPRMVYLTYEAFGGQPDPVVAQVAAATELLHQSVLIHDDIIDRDTIRYGVANISGGYLEHYRTLLPDDQQRRHYADSAAILAGDILLSAAYELLMTAGISGSTLRDVQILFSRSIFEVVGGELIDTEAAFRGGASDHALNVARYKTAGYSFISPLQIGATLAGASESEKEALRQFSEQLGIAFQLQDDILGIFGDETVTGKSSTGDIKEGKRTYMVECFEGLASPEQLINFHKHYGTASADADTVRKLLMDSGARSQVELKISQLESQAIAALAALKLDAEHHGKFLQLITKSLKRSF